MRVPVLILSGAALVAALLFALDGYRTVHLESPQETALLVRPANFPHDALTRVLDSYVDAHGLVDYRGLALDRAPLEHYLAAVASSSPRSHPELFPTREDELAYWLNAYNAYVLYAVTERPQMRSVADARVGFYHFTRYRFGTDAYTLAQLEQEILRPRFADARVSIALHRACLGCPPLAREAFQPDRLATQLDRHAVRWCASTAAVAVGDEHVEASELFEGLAPELEGLGGPLGFCRTYGREDLPRDRAVRYHRSDWTLNAQPGRALHY